MSEPVFAGWIGGHSSNSEYGNFKVPDGCTVVMKALPGEYIAASDRIACHRKMINKLKTNSEFESILKNPEICHLHILQEVFGDIMIYYERELCPYYTTWILIKYDT
jgi:hypothetical protein